MLYNYIGRNADELLPTLMGDLLAADEIGSRAGRVRELMHVGITLTQPWQREFLTPIRKPSIAAQIAETMWVLSGREDVEWLEHYLPRAAEFSDDGKVWRGAYGPRLRAWPRAGSTGDVIDQLALVVDMLRESPATRRAVATIYDPSRDSSEGKDIPCNNWLSFSSRLGYLDLHVAIRSNDAMWGWSGINAFEWSVVQEVVAGLLQFSVGGLHFSTTSFHLYDRHWAKAADIVKHGAPLPRLTDSPRFDASVVDYDLEKFDDLMMAWFDLEQSIRDGKMATSWVDEFPEPMLRSWLRVLQWWWSGDRKYLEPLDGTALGLASYYSMQPVEPVVDERPDPLVAAPLLTDAVLVPELFLDLPQPDPSEFLDYVVPLHMAKHEAYGDSWCRRGETLGILANVARKVDRLGGAETPDETSVDTAIDLMVYLAKYAAWLESGENDPYAANQKLYTVEQEFTWSPRADLASGEEILRGDFEHLTQLVETGNPFRKFAVLAMLQLAYSIARTRWEQVQA